MTSVFGINFSAIRDRGNKDVERSFDLPMWLFWWLLSNSRIISPFREKEIPT